MLQKIERPLNKRERRLLSRSLTEAPRTVTGYSTLGWLSLSLGILALCMFLFAKGLSQSGIWTFIIPVVFIVGILSFYFAYLVVSSYFHWIQNVRRFARADAPQIRAALTDGKASVCVVTSDRAIVIEEYEDEGSAYIYDLGDGTCLYLRGQVYFPEDENTPWPARQFEIVRAGLNGRLIGIFTGQEPVPQTRTVPMAEMPKTIHFCDEPSLLSH